ncbi:MAG: hypothetical protein AB1414_03860, partial [bacterium]
LEQKLNNKEINVEDVYQLAVAYGADATKLIALATKNATNQELMELINKDRGGNKEVSEALKGERDIRINEAIKDLSTMLDPLTGGLPADLRIQKGMEYSLKINQLGGEIKPGGIITVPAINESGQSTTTSIVGLDDLVKDWWLGIAADVGVSSIPAIGDLYDAFTVVSGYSLSGPLTPMERALVAGTLICGVNSIPGVSGGAARLGLKTALKNVLENHHLLPKAFKEDFIKMGFSKKELELLTKELPIDLHRLSPEGLHAKTINWNKQWEKWLRETPPSELTKANALNYLETMIRNHETHFTKQGVDEILEKINKLK